MAPRESDDVLKSVHGLLLQDWITIRGKDDTIKVTQGSTGWLELGDFEDLAFFLDVREVQAPAKMNYETSPTKQDGAFVAMMPAFTLSMGQRVDRVFTSTSAVPPARYVRWRLTNGGGAPWDLTFRLWVAAYAWRKW